jgi:hypothetical protein
MLILPYKFLESVAIVVFVVVGPREHDTNIHHIRWNAFRSVDHKDYKINSLHLITGNEPKITKESIPILLQATDIKNHISW